MPGPITAFGFLNTLQALEDLPFDEGMRKGARLHGCQPYLPEERYRERMSHGRIQLEDLEIVLRKELQDRADAPIASLTKRCELRLAMLQYSLPYGPREELRWFVAETETLARLREQAPLGVRQRFVEETRRWVMRDVRNCQGQSAGAGDSRSRRMLADLVERFGESSIERWSPQTWESLSLHALWRTCCEGVRAVEAAAPPHEAPLRHRDVLLEAAGEDSDVLVHELLIRFCAAFADQGLATWPLPNREQGFFRAFCALYGQGGGPPERWLRGLPRELSRLAKARLGAIESIEESLALLGVAEDQWDEFIIATLLALRGWAGMLWQMETRSDRVAQPAPPGTLAEFLAVRLVLERLALSHLAGQSLDHRGPLDGMCDAARAKTPRPESASVEQRALLVFHLAQVLGWSPPTLHRLAPRDWAELIAEIESFSELERRWTFHQAYERRFRIQSLDALAAHGRRAPQPAAGPRFQIAFCIDAREESFRRHVEEIAPSTETFGAPGFFGVAMYYRGAAEANFAALCPIVVKPQHWVVEDVVYTFEGSHRRRARRRRALGAASHQVHVGSRGIAGGWLLTAGIGVLASVPLVARVLFPRLTARIRRTAGRFVRPPSMTRLRLERTAPTPGPGEEQLGYSIEEMANVGERMLRDIGLTSDFARLVVFLGHGSFCMNNPHKSAYDCGACSGSPGGANGRALAAMLNDRRVREILARRGLHVPDDTLFLGGLHNTAVDSVTFYDLDLLPKSHTKDFEALGEILAEACQRNAHERCRRFDSAPLDLSFEAAHRHVEGRSEDLAQTRPEFGNASNAVCIVGRRERTRGLYLDRRAFLTSYDPTADDAQHSILARILAAAVPVCEGINMQYNLSSIDSKGWACGTKLPHNVTSLLGVMDGAASDLRPGLPWQGVEIHEPLRLLFVVETTPEAMLAIMDRNEIVGRILRNGWAQLAVLDPDSSQIQVFRNDAFHVYRPESAELPRAACSADWYRGWRDHLGFASIERPLGADAPSRMPS